MNGWRRITPRLYVLQLLNSVCMHATLWRPVEPSNIIAVQSRLELTAFWCLLWAPYTATFPYRMHASVAPLISIFSQATRTACWLCYGILRVRKASEISECSSSVSQPGRIVAHEHCSGFGSLSRPLFFCGAVCFYWLVGPVVGSLFFYTPGGKSAGAEFFCTVFFQISLPYVSVLQGSWLLYSSCITWFCLCSVLFFVFNVVFVGFLCISFSSSLLMLNGLFLAIYEHSLYCVGPFA